MPIYEYKCTQCGQVSSFLEKSDSRGDHPCEHCGSTDTVKAFSTFAASSNRASDSKPPSCSGECASGACPFS